MTRPKVAAVDPSLTGTAVATTWGALTTIRPGSRKGPQRLDHLERRLVAEVAGADLVVLEGYSFGSGKRGGEDGDGTSFRMTTGEWGGVIRLALYRLGIPYVEVPPAKVKVFACGNGMASKPEVLLAAVKRLGYEGSSFDEADALWLLEMALHAYGWPSIPLPHKHTRALTEGRGVVEWPSLTKERTDGRP